MRKLQLNTRSIVIIALSVMAFNFIIGILSIPDYQQAAIIRLIIGTLLSGAIVAGLLLLYATFTKRK